MKNLPVRTPADFFARSEAPVSIGPSGQGTLLSKKAVEAFLDSPRPGQMAGRFQFVLEYSLKP